MTKAAQVPAPHVDRSLDVIRVHDQDLFRFAVSVPVDHYMASESAGDQLRGVFNGLLQRCLGRHRLHDPGCFNDCLGQIRLCVAQRQLVVSLIQRVIFDLDDLRLRFYSKLRMDDRDGIAEVYPLECCNVLVFFRICQADKADGNVLTDLPVLGLVKVTLCSRSELRFGRDFVLELV